MFLLAINYGLLFKISISKKKYKSVLLFLVRFNLKVLFITGINIMPMLYKKKKNNKPTIFLYLLL